MINPMDLTGKHIIITGASSGIGRAASIQASKLGAHVTLIARNEEKLNETVSLMSGDMHNIVPADLTEIDKIDGLIADISERFGAIDGLVHCAGLGLNRPIKLAKPEFVEQVTRLNTLLMLSLSALQLQGRDPITAQAISESVL